MDEHVISLLFENKICYLLDFAQSRTVNDQFSTFYLELQKHGYQVVKMKSLYQLNTLSCEHYAIYIPLYFERLMMFNKNYKSISDIIKIDGTNAIIKNNCILNIISEKWFMNFIDLQSNLEKRNNQFKHMKEMYNLHTSFYDILTQYDKDDLARESLKFEYVIENGKQTYYMCGGHTHNLSLQNCLDLMNDNTQRDIVPEKEYYTLLQSLKDELHSLLS